MGYMKYPSLSCKFRKLKHWNDVSTPLLARIFVRRGNHFTAIWAAYLSRHQKAADLIIAPDRPDCQADRTQRRRIRSMAGR